MVVIGTLSEGLLKTFFCVLYGEYSWVFLSSSITLMVVVGTMIEGLLTIFFCVLYGEYSLFFSHFINNFAGSGWDSKQRTSCDLFLRVLGI